MSIKLLRNLGTIKNPNPCLSVIKSKVNKRYAESTQKMIAVDLERYCEKNLYIIYFNDEYSIREETSFDLKYKWVYTGLKDENDLPLFLQFILISDSWQGAMVGTAGEILQAQTDRDGIFYMGELNIINEHINSMNLQDMEMQPLGVTLEKELEEKSIVQEEPEKDYVEYMRSKSSLDCDLTASFYVELYDRLLINTGWELETNSLRCYIDGIITKVNHLLRKGKTSDGYIFIRFNDSKTTALLNSGLLDKFGKSIFFTSTIMKDGTISFVDISLVGSMMNLVKSGFPSDSTKELERVRFYKNSKTELIFSAKESNIDLDSWARLSHCISGRILRYPEEFREKPLETLYQDLLLAVKYGVKLSRYDISYVKPFYNRKEDCINFIIPYHVGNNFQKEAELGIVMSNNNEYGVWQIMTILDRKTWKENVKLLNPYERESL